MEKGRREAKKPIYSSSSPGEQRRLRSNNFHSNRSENNAQVSKRGSTCSSSTLDENYDQSQDSSNLPSLVGTCLDMCPARERAQRERLRDLSLFERLNGNPGRTSPSLAVKKVKFHIISHHKLLRCSSNPNISSAHYLNMEQLTKSLLSLYDLYNANRKFNSINRNEAEFLSFYVLLHLGFNGESMGESLSTWFRLQPSSVTKSKEMRFARKVLRFFRVGNYKCFFSTIASEASYLQFCLMEPFINEIRVEAISCINYGGYKLHPYPLEHLSKILMLKESNVESLCKACGLEITTDEAGNKLLPTKQTGFCRPKGGFHKYSFLDIERFQRQTMVKHSRIVN